MTNRHAAAPADILSDSRWFPEALDAQNRTLYFVRTDRQTIASRAFLSQSLWSNDELPRQPLGLETVARAVPPASPPINFIWHTSYCCSTAISQALDMPGRNCSVREPDALTVLARMARGTRGSLGAEGRRYLGSLLCLLGRPFVPGERITIKPANAANCLIRDAAALTSGKSLFLYSDCRTFMMSVAQGGETRRTFVRRLFGELIADGHEQKNWSTPRLLEMSDMQIAALVWHMQIAEFVRSAPALGDRLASLDCDAFLTSPAETISRVAQFFDIDLPQEHIGELVSGPFLKRNVKDTDSAFDAGKRLAQQRAVNTDLDEILAWSYEVCRATPRGVPLPAPLMEVAKTYGP